MPIKLRGELIMRDQEVETKRCRKDCGCVSQPSGFYDLGVIGMTRRNCR